MANDSKEFGRWRSKDAYGKLSSPIELLILGSLRYLGRGFTFDDIQEFTCISREVHRNFFHAFIEWGSTALFKMYVSAPMTDDQAEHHLKIIFSLSGIGSHRKLMVTEKQLISKEAST
jgi:hypothetical protein